MQYGVAIHVVTTEQQNWLLHYGHPALPPRTTVTPPYPLPLRSRRPAASPTPRLRLAIRARMSVSVPAHV